MRSWGWGLDGRICVFMRRDTRYLSLSLFVKWGHSEKVAFWNSARELSLAAKSSVLWSWTSQLPELWEIDPCCLSHPVYDTLLWQTKLTKTIGIKLLKDMVSLIFEESISLGERLMTGNIWMITMLFSVVLTFYSLNILLEAGQRRKNILAL